MMERTSLTLKVAGMRNLFSLSNSKVSLLLRVGHVGERGLVGVLASGSLNDERELVGVLLNSFLCPLLSLLYINEQ